MKSLGSGGGIRYTMGTIGDEELYDVGGIKVLPITNYHCVMKCANQLSQATMGPILQPGFENEYNHECVLIENLDYCVQLWKVMNNVDCEVPIRTMVANTFGVSKRKNCRKHKTYVSFFTFFKENDAPCMRDYADPSRYGNIPESKWILPRFYD